MLDAATEALAALGTATGTGLLSAAAASVAVVAAVAPADCQMLAAATTLPPLKPSLLLCARCPVEL